MGSVLLEINNITFLKKRFLIDSWHCKIILNITTAKSKTGNDWNSIPKLSFEIKGKAVIAIKSTIIKLRKRILDFILLLLEAI